MVFDFCLKTYTTYDDLNLSVRDIKNTLVGKQEGEQKSRGIGGTNRFDLCLTCITVINEYKCFHLSQMTKCGGTNVLKTGGISCGSSGAGSV